MELEVNVNNLVACAVADLNLICLTFLEASLERDRFMDPTEAKEFGIIDEVLVHPPKPGVETENEQSS